MRLRLSQKGDVPLVRPVQQPASAKMSQKPDAPPKDLKASISKLRKRVMDTSLLMELYEASEGEVARLKAETVELCASVKAEKIRRPFVSAASTKGRRMVYPIHPILSQRYFLKAKTKQAIATVFVINYF